MRAGPVARGQVKELETSMDGGGWVDGWVASIVTWAGMHGNPLLNSLF